MFGPIELLMAVGPVLGYIDQYRIFLSSRSSIGFPLQVPFILLTSSILRIAFWFGKHFDTVLLIQSCLMILAQLLVLHAAVKYRGVDYASPEHSIRTGKQESFWNWSSFTPYIQFLTLFTLIIIGLQWLLGWHAIYVEIIGALAMTIEATLPLPQVVENYSRKSTAGFSLVVLGTWFFGDAFKTYYYVRAVAPMQFIACGMFQLSMDTVLVLQMVYYSQKQSRIRVD